LERVQVVDPGRFGVEEVGNTTLLVEGWPQER
jgi:hypothetical protein